MHTGGNPAIKNNISIMVNFISLAIFGYFLGSIPWGYLICKTRRIDIRQIGSGGTGGTNVSRALGKKFGFLVAILDVAKAAIPVYLVTELLFVDWQIAICVVMPVLGHIFPVWLKFKGGKGVASALGALLVLLGWPAVLILILVQISILTLIKIVSFSSLAMASLIPLTVAAFSHSLPLYFSGVALMALIWWAHRENLQRIKEGRESEFKFKN